MFVFIRLSDRTILCGRISNDDEYYLTITNAVEMGTRPLSNLAGMEQQYYFRGMYSPFSICAEILTELPKDLIVTIHSDLDTGLEAAYMRFVEDWFTTRNRVNERALKKGTQEIDNLTTEEPLSEDNSLDMLEAILTRQGLANNEIH